MTPISPQDRNKVIGLVAAVVVVFGLLFWRIMGASAPETKPPDTVRLDTPTTPATSGAVAAAKLPVVAVNLPANAAGLNPFRTVLSSVAASSGPSAPVRPPKNLGNGGGMGPVLPIVGKDLPTEEPHLTGVMSGDPPLGVFTVAGKEEIARVGDTLSNGLTVRSISGNSAVLSKNKMTLKLTVAASK